MVVVGIFYAEDFGVLGLETEAVVHFALDPRFEVDDVVYLFGVLDGAHTEDSSDVDDADAAELDVVPDNFRRAADEGLRGDALDFDGVVGD